MALAWVQGISTMTLSFVTQAALLQREKERESVWFPLFFPLSPFENRSSSLREGDINKENIPAAGSVSGASSCGVSVGEEGVRRDYQTSQGGLHHEGPRPRKPKHCHQSPTLGQLSDNQDPHAVSHSLSSSLSFSVSLSLLLIADVCLLLPCHAHLYCRPLVEFRWRSNIQNSTSKTITCLLILRCTLIMYFHSVMFYTPKEQPEPSSSLAWFS